MVAMQLYSDITIALRDIFKYLEVHELLKVSIVCNAWNIIAMNDSVVSTIFNSFCIAANLIYIDQK